MTMTDTLTVPVAFGPPRAATAPDGAMRVVVPTDGERGDVELSARLHRPGVIRDALLAMGDVLSSDLVRKPTDRADYLAYLISRGKGVSKQVWDAQKEYLALQYGAAAKRDEPLDPVLTVTADAVRLEVLSRDESTYAQLALRRPAALVDARHPGDAGGARGTTHIDLAAALSSIARIRAYRPTTLELAPAPQPAARTRTVPLRWLRAFGQMQAASVITADRFELSPIDLYNVLLSLRLRKARTAPRGLRYELVPGEPPRLVLEPWDLVVRSTGGPYRGAQPRVIRTWGRTRLNVLARILPHARKLTVAVAGAGLPSLYVVDLGDATLALSLSGWTDAAWAGIATFDLLTADDDPGRIAALVDALATPLDEAALADKLGRPRTEARRTVLAALSQLRVGHDLATGELYARSLTGAPLPAGALTYRDPREAAAHRLLAEAGAMTLTKVHDQGDEGRAIEGQAVDAKAHRTFYPAFTIDRESRTSAATCTCSAFRRAGIKEGPCEHLIALRVLYAREQARLEAARGTAEGRALITAETRVLMRRTARGAELYRLSLDGRTVTARFGIGEQLRMQRLRFDSGPEARTAYFQRLEDLSQKGYLDATQE
jgi:SWIM zinc finger